MLQRYSFCILTPFECQHLTCPKLLTVTVLALALVLAALMPQSFWCNFTVVHNSKFDRSQCSQVCGIMILSRKTTALCLKHAVHEMMSSVLTTHQYGGFESMVMC